MFPKTIILQIYIKVTKVTEERGGIAYTNYRNGGTRMKKRACVDQKLCVACGCELHILDTVF